MLYASHLESLNGFFAPWAEHDAIMEVADGTSPAGQGRERWRGAHPRHSIGHCGEITSLIDSLATIVIVLVIGYVCQGRGREVQGWGEGQRVTDTEFREKQTEKDEQKEGKVEKRRQRKTSSLKLI